MTQARPYLPQPEAIAGFLKDSLREVGIEATIAPRNVNQHFEHLMAGKHELGLAGWNSDNSDPDNFLYSLLDPDNIAGHRGRQQPQPLAQRAIPRADARRPAGE